MKTKNLTLTNINVRYDNKTADIILTSKDPKVKGKPFQLKLSANTSTYDTLLTLLEAEGLVDLEATKIPKSIHIPSPKQTDSPTGEHKTKIRIGETFNSEIVELDLKYSPHTLIVGSTGSGKSVLQRLIITHASSHPKEIELYGIDLKKVELSPYFRTSPENLATTVKDAMKLTEKLEQIITERYEVLEQLKLNSYENVPEFKAIYVVIDELCLITEKTGINTPESQIEDAQRTLIENLLTNISRLGRAAGVYLFIGTQRLNAVLLKGEFKANLTTRILMGISNATTTHTTLGSKLKYGGALLRNRGRAIVETFGQQKLVQTYYLQHETSENS